jgi:hypothetical protein
VAHGAAGDSGGGRMQLLVTVVVPAMTVLTVSSPIFSVFSSLLHFSLSFLSSLSLSFFCLFSLVLPLFL